MKLIYVGGPYSAGSEIDVQNNIDTAVGWGEVVRFLGAVPVVPHMAILPGLKIEDAMRECFTLLERCHGIYLMPGYQLSRGTCRELCMAMINGIPVFYTAAELAYWIKTGNIGREFQEPMPPQPSENDPKSAWINWEDAVSVWETTRNRCKIIAPLDIKLNSTMEQQAARHRRFLVAQSFKRLVGVTE